jgi:hypothetical protein
MQLPKFKPVLKIGIRIGLAAAASFLFLETLLFVFEPQVFQRSFYVFDPDLGFRVRPYAVYGTNQANQYGFNDRDYPEERIPGTCRILFLGDSFNWMGGQTENYTAVLESLFESRFGPGRVEVISAGYSMTHTGEQLALYRKFASRYHPDLVVLGFFSGNDFYDALPNRRRIVFAGVPTDVFLDREFYAVIFGRPFLLRSRLLSFIKGFAEYRSAWWEHQKNLLPPEGRRSDASLEDFPEVVDRSPTAKQAAFTAPSPGYAESLRLRFEFCDPRREAQYRVNVEYLERAVRELSGYLRQHDTRFLLSIFPDRAQIDSQLREFVAQSEGRNPSSFDWNRPQEILAALCKKDGIGYFDLTDPFRRAHERGWSLYLSNDTHWNREGNRLAAELFYLNLEGWVDDFLDRSKSPSPSGSSQSRTPPMEKP